MSIVTIGKDKTVRVHSPIFGEAQQNENQLYTPLSSQAKKLRLENKIIFREISRALVHGHEITCITAFGNSFSVHTNILLNPILFSFVLEVMKVRFAFFSHHNFFWTH